MFIWIPYHKEVEGNEETDKEARQAANSGTEDVSSGSNYGIIKSLNSSKFTEM